MADPNAKVEMNVPGKYYVDKECIGCTQCVTVAESIFGFDEDKELAFVKKQPETKEEEEAARRAMDECPVQAIGDDG